MNPAWYEPAQFINALGVTLPFFLYYGYRIYSLMLDHRAALRRLCDARDSTRLVRELRHADDITVQLALGEVFMQFDRELGARRRALRTDAQAVVLLGFMGTLIGVSDAFASLASFRWGGGREAFGLVEQLVGGGLATALLSSLVAACLGVVALGYLAATEGAVASARQRVLAACRADLCSIDAPEPRRVACVR